MNIRIVTVSREFGSGGRTIAKKLAERTGWAYYDNEIITKIAQESGFAETFVKEHGEYAGSNNSLLYSLNNWNNGGVDDKLYTLQHNLIRSLAEQGPCIIVGRCADYILKDRTDCLNTFIHADLEFRADRITRIYRDEHVGELPEKRLRDKNKRRAAYYRHYTGRQWGQAQNYHLCLNSGMLGLERCVGMIGDLL
ncbi:MAG: AAA family ATPase [Butyricicoccaceae bacterium]